MLYYDCGDREGKLACSHVCICAEKWKKGGLILGKTLANSAGSIGNVLLNSCRAAINRDGGSEWVDSNIPMTTDIQQRLAPQKPRAQMKPQFST